MVDFKSNPFSPKSVRIFLLLFGFLCATSSGFAQVGINTITPLSTLDINGNLSVKTMTLIGSATATEINDGVYISLNPQANDQVFNLPSAVDFPGRIYFLRNISNTQTAAISASGGLFFYKNTTVEANSTTHQIYLYESNRSVFVISDGLNWTVFN
jgi:hypothetical protein